MCVLSCFSHVQHFATLWTVAHRAPLSMGFSGQKYWSGLLCLPPGGFPNQGIEPMSLTLPGKPQTSRIEVSKLFPTGRIQPVTCLCMTSKPRNVFMFFIIVMYLFTCLASLGVSCSTWDLPSSLWHVGSLVVAYRNFFFFSCSMWDQDS